MDKITKALHTRVNLENAKPLVTPIFQSSAFLSDSPFFYTRKDNPNIKEFEEAVLTLEEAEFCIATTTGMSAITMVISLLSPGETLVVNKHIYGCSYKLLQKFTSRLGVKLVTLDLSSENSFSLIPAETSIVLFETPTNPFLKTISIKKVSEYVKVRNPTALIVVDNTWATPLFQQPLKLGADISICSATKYFSGHSDVMGGCILTSDESLYRELLDIRFYYGCILTPHSSWLLKRSLQTLSIRMEYHQKSTLEMHLFLHELASVKRVYYPEIDGVQLTGYGTLLFFELREDLVNYYEIFAESLELFDTGTGMACVTSMIAQPYTGSHASMSDEEKKDMGLTKGLIRISIGMENTHDLKEDLKRSFQIIEKLANAEEFSIKK